MYDLFANKDLEDGFAESDSAEAYGDQEEEEPQDISDLLGRINMFNTGPSCNLLFFY